ncbi:MAG: metal-dependent hydrolase [Thermoplasmata archaeon]|nr:metal-dependent hydrolase [Candidatus Sysuiplasma acidicola]MDH2906344.1 metal-dependent hydrolase [Methanomassiliicoccales archaeon]
MAKLTWLGHSAFVFEGRNRVLFDPFISGNPVAKVKPAEITADMVCVSHGHGDHVGDAVDIAKRNKAPIASIYELAVRFDSKGAKAEQLNVGGGCRILDSEIRMVNAIHSSDVFEGDNLVTGGSPAGFVVESGVTVYHAGDTGYFGDMKWIGEFHKPKIALLPIGDRFTMGIREAAYAASVIQPEIVVPMHYGTFPLIEQEPAKFEEEVRKLTGGRVRTKIMRVGETIDV